MSESFCIKTEPIAKDYELGDNDAITLSYNTTNLEHFTNTVNDIKEDEIDLDKMEEYVSENIDKSTIDIKEEDVDEMDEFLPESAPNIYPLSSLKWKSDGCTEVINHDEELREHATQQHLTSTITPQISLPKLEIIDMHTDENDSEGPETNGDTDANVSDNKERSIVLSSLITQTHTKHKCELCGNSYEEKRNLMRHMREKHPLSANDGYICEICNERFATQIGLDKHYYWKHSEAQTPTEHKCEICGIYFKKVVYLQIHIRKKHPSSIDAEYICKICNERFTTRRGRDKHFYRMHPVVQTSAEHKCEICGSCYLDSRTLQTHIRKKHPSSIDSEYICQICNQRFTTQRGVDSHLYQKHRTVTEHKCEICGICFKEASNLQKHIRKQHPSSIDTEYICEICNQRFPTQSGLGRHSYRMHPVAQTSAEHKCEICGSCYLESRTLRSHIRKKHPSSIDTEYICEICNQRFTTRRGLDKHSDLKHQLDKTPTEHKCEM
ncbi:uncharacterized protein isoform X1 [Musca autumnalis]|uniref:uncharacterized protein isoform X1 n=1 Tax=Musca autumnalis TaxID=221902 RepID=UPI003CE74013